MMIGFLKITFIDKNTKQKIIPNPHLFIGDAISNIQFSKIDSINKELIFKYTIEKMDNVLLELDVIIDNANKNSICVNNISFEVNDITNCLTSIYNYVNLIRGETINQGKRMVIIFKKDY